MGNRGIFNPRQAKVVESVAAPQGLRYGEGLVVVDDDADTIADGLSDRFKDAGPALTPRRLVQA